MNIIKVLSGKIKDLGKYAYPDSFAWSITNPSIGYDKDNGFFIFLRSSNYYIDEHGYYKPINAKHIYSNILFSELSKDFDILNLQKVEYGSPDLPISSGLEDPKTFYREGSLYFTANATDRFTHVSRMFLCKYEKETNSVSEIQKLPYFHTMVSEKNWMTTYEKNNNFDYIYKYDSIIKDKNVIGDSDIDIRGGSNLHKLKDGNYLSISLSLQLIQDEEALKNSLLNQSTKHYMHCFIMYNEFGKVIKKSDYFSFTDSPIEFAAGLVEYEDQFVISFGVNDISAHLAFLPQDGVLKMLKEI